MKLQSGSRGSVRSSSAARRLHWRSTEQRWFKTRNWLREMVPSGLKRWGVCEDAGGFLRRGLGRRMGRRVRD